MDIVFDIAQLVIGIVMIAAILLQNKGGGLGAAFGGGETVATTRRGAEKGLYNVTIVLATIFVSLAVARMLIG